MLSMTKFDKFCFQGHQRHIKYTFSQIEYMDYHERLKKLGLYSLERRRERFLIINAWQQLEGEKENVLGLKTGKEGRRRCLRGSWHHSRWLNVLDPLCFTSGCNH